jgi:hypothetical protein
MQDRVREVGSLSGASPLREATEKPAYCTSRNIFQGSVEGGETGF